MLNAQQYDTEGVSDFEETSQSISLEERAVQHCEPDENALLDHLALDELSSIISSMPGSGKTTSLLYALWRFLQEWPMAIVRIADPKGSRWLGLENCPGVVTQLITDRRPRYPDAALDKLDDDTLAVASELVWLHGVVDGAWNEMRDRIKQRAKLAKAGQPAPVFAPYLAIIDEWMAALIKWENIPSNTRQLLGINNLKIKVQDLIAKGRELGVRVWLVSQSHLCSRVGLDASMRDGVNLLGVGRRNSQGGGGMASVTRLVADHNVFPDEGDRRALRMALKIATNEGYGADGSPIIVSSHGIGFIGITDDLRWVNEEDLGVSYLQHHPDLRRSSQPKLEPTGVVLTPAAQAIQDWTKKKERPVRLNEINRSGLAALNGFGADQIAQVLEELKNAEQGKVWMDGATTFYLPH